MCAKYIGTRRSPAENIFHSHNEALTMANGTQNYRHFHIAKNRTTTRLAHNFDGVSETFVQIRAFFYSVCHFELADRTVAHRQSNRKSMNSHQKKKKRPDKNGCELYYATNDCGTIENTGQPLEKRTGDMRKKSEEKKT